MTEQRALKFFRGEEGYNCAQAVLKALEEVCPVDEAMIQQYANAGGGRGEGGVCGALLAAKALLADPAAIARLEARFREEAGALTCRDIRKQRRVTCSQCVGAAARLLSEELRRTAGG